MESPFAMPASAARAAENREQAFPLDRLVDVAVKEVEHLHLCVFSHLAFRNGQVEPQGRNGFRFPDGARNGPAVNAGHEEVDEGHREGLVCLRAVRQLVQHLLPVSCRVDVPDAQRTELLGKTRGGEPA